MPKKPSHELQQIARMSIDNAIKIIVTLDYKSTIKDKAIPLSQIIPYAPWQTLNQGQKGYVGLVFYALRKDLGFEYAGKDETGRTNLYRLIEYVDL